MTINRRIETDNLEVTDGAAQNLDSMGYVRNKNPN